MVDEVQIHPDEVEDDAEVMLIWDLSLILKFFNFLGAYHRNFKFLYNFFFYILPNQWGL